jgi:hypothetical protein
LLIAASIDLGVNSCGIRPILSAPDRRLVERGREVGLLHLGTGRSPMTSTLTGGSWGRPSAADEIAAEVTET